MALSQLLLRLRERWGGGIRPSLSIDGSFIERWDADGEGPARCIHVEGFGLTAMVFFGPTPPKGQTVKGLLP